MGEPSRRWWSPATGSGRRVAEVEGELPRAERHGCRALTPAADRPAVGHRAPEVLVVGQADQPGPQLVAPSATRAGRSPRGFQSTVIPGTVAVAFARSWDSADPSAHNLDRCRCSQAGSRPACWQRRARLWPSSSRESSCGSPGSRHAGQRPVQWTVQWTGPVGRGERSRRLTAPRLAREPGPRHREAQPPPRRSTPRTLPGATSGRAAAAEARARGRRDRSPSRSGRSTCWAASTHEGLCRSARESSAPLELQAWSRRAGSTCSACQEVQGDQLNVLYNQLGGYSIWPGRALGNNGVRLQIAYRADLFELVGHRRDHDQVRLHVPPRPLRPPPRPGDRRGVLGG